MKNILTILSAAAIVLTAAQVQAAPFGLAVIESESVPDGGTTAALLGMAFCGIAALRSKMR